MDWTALPLSRATVDRAAERRKEPGLLGRLLADPTTRVLLVRDGEVPVRDVDGTVALDLRGPEAVPADVPAPLLLFLGEDGPAGRPRSFVACVLPGAGPEDEAGPTSGGRAGGVARSGTATRAPAEPDLDARPGADVRWATLREVGAVLPDADAGLAVAAVGLAGWHERHPRCPRCGAPTEPAEAGWTRRCTEDGSDHYPRTDPAVIMAVTDADDRLLLARPPRWPERRFSTLAGFVEPGESLEAAVRREVAEEVGLRIGAVTYRGSQPWPFPASLMLAFVARAETIDVAVDGEEISEAHWFTRAELAAATAERRVLLPAATSVSRALVEDWFGGNLPDGW